jgi:hypothetical protein
MRVDGLFLLSVRGAMFEVFLLWPCRSTFLATENSLLTATEYLTGWPIGKHSKRPSNGLPVSNFDDNYQG